MQILNLRMIYFFLFVGITCFCFPKLLLNTSFGTFFLAAMSLFCFGRTIEQFVFIRIEHPMVHFLTYLFIIGALLFAIPIFL
ncbi:MAG TPA: hypothetical protein VFG10_05625 [Saprospiraceae bacterium]|nr:hypothetical protein [Saprospiraceae bacterium]